MLPEPPSFEDLSAVLLANMPAEAPEAEPEVELIGDTEPVEAVAETAETTDEATGSVETGDDAPEQTFEPSFVRHRR